MIIAILLLLSSILFLSNNYPEKILVFQPCLSNNISIMRDNDHFSTEQPTVIASGNRTDRQFPSDERGLLKFDLSKLPKGWIVKEAHLQLYAIDTYIWNQSEWLSIPSSARTIQLHRITSNWTGWGFTYWTHSNYYKTYWDTPGGDYEESVVKVSYEYAKSWNTWIVTNDIIAWYENGEPNYGWLLKDFNEGSTIGYRVEYMNWFYIHGIEYSPKLTVHLMQNASCLQDFGRCLLVSSLFSLIWSNVELFRSRIAYKKETNCKKYIKKS